MKGNEPVYLRFWFVWLILTILYVLSFSFGGLVGSGKSILAFLGLFVPMGIFSAINAFSSVYGLLALLPIAFAIFSTSRIASMFGIVSPSVKIFFYLFVLLLITFVTDFILYHSWASLALFFDCHSVIRNGMDYIPYCGTTLF